MSKLLDALKIIFRPKPKRPLTPTDKQGIAEQVIIVDRITRGE